jgi:chromosome segregation ATPase
LSDSPELLKPGTEVTDTELQIKLGNLETENETLKTDYAALLESSTAVTNRLKEELQKVRSQLETERADREEVEGELSDLRQKSVTASQEFLEPADLLNQLKGRRKKSRTDLADIEVILGLLNQAGSSL